MTTKQITIVVTGAVLAVLALCLTTLMVWGPQDVQSQISMGFAWFASSGAVVAAMRWLRGDDDADGVSNLAELIAGTYGAKEGEEE